MSSLLFNHVEVAGVVVDVLVGAGKVVAVGTELSTRSDVTDDTVVVDGQGGALIPGLHDHHLHLLALAAAERSVRVGPPDLNDEDAFEAALRRADETQPPTKWLRAVGYHESVAASLDRWRLDAVVPGRPLRVQHRSGAQWILNSAAVGRLNLDDATDVPGIERDDAGRPTGRLLGLDAWLRDRLPADDPPDLAAVGRKLSRYGVTGVTDATPTDRVGDLELLAAAAASGALPQRVVVTGGVELANVLPPRPLCQGPVKFVIADHALPALDDVIGAMRAAHRHHRAIAVHCVTREALVLALTAWHEASAYPGDRIEHAAVVPPELQSTIADGRLTVVTQPNFVAERGDRYLVEVDPVDQPNLYRCRTLLDAGIPVGASTDAPFGDPDPWRAIAAAIERRTAAGTVLGADERVEPRRALDLFLTPPHDPGGRPRRVAPGEPADLCLLAAPLAEVLHQPTAAHVAATVHGGELRSWT